MLALGVGYLIVQWHAIAGIVRKRLLILLLGLAVGFLIDAQSPGNFARMAENYTGASANFSGIVALALHMTDELVISFLPLIGYGFLRVYFGHPVAFRLARTNLLCLLYASIGWVACFVAIFPVY